MRQNLGTFIFRMFSSSMSSTVLREINKNHFVLIFCNFKNAYFNQGEERKIWNGFCLLYNVCHIAIYKRRARARLLDGQPDIRAQTIFTILRPYYKFIIYTAC